MSRLLVRTSTDEKAVGSSPLLDMQAWAQLRPEVRVIKTAGTTHRTVIVTRSRGNTQDVLSMFEPIGFGRAVHTFIGSLQVTTLSGFIGADGTWQGHALVVCQTKSAGGSLELPRFLARLNTLVKATNYLCWQGQLKNNAPDGLGSLKSDCCSLDGRWENGRLLTAQCVNSVNGAKNPQNSLSRWQYQLTNDAFKALVTGCLKTNCALLGKPFQPVPQPQVKLAWEPTDPTDPIVNKTDASDALSNLEVSVPGWGKVAEIFTSSADGPVRPASEMLAYLISGAPVTTVESVLSSVPDPQARQPGFLSAWKEGYRVLAQVAKMLQAKVQNTPMFSLFRVTLHPPLVPKRMTLSFDKFPNLLDEVAVRYPLPNQKTDIHGVYWQDGELRFVGVWRLKQDPKSSEHKICMPLEGAKYADGKWGVGTFRKGRLASGKLYDAPSWTLGLASSRQAENTVTGLIGEGQWKRGKLHGGPGKLYQAEGKALLEECDKWHQGNKQGRGAVYHLLQPGQTEPVVAQRGIFKDDLLDCADGETFAADGHPTASGVFREGDFVGPGIRWVWDPVQKTYERIVVCRPTDESANLSASSSTTTASTASTASTAPTWEMHSQLHGAVRAAAAGTPTAVYGVKPSWISSMRYSLADKPNVRLVTAHDLENSATPLKLLRDATHLWMDDDLSWGSVRKLLTPFARATLLPPDERLMALAKGNRYTLRSLAALLQEINGLEPPVPVIATSTDRVPDTIRELMPDNTEYCCLNQSDQSD